MSDGILVDPAGHAVAMIDGILGEDRVPDVPWSGAYLRAWLAEHPPAGYKTWEARVAEMEAARQTGQAGGAR